MDRLLFLGMKVGYLGIIALGIGLVWASINMTVGTASIIIDTVGAACFGLGVYLELTFNGSSR